MSTEVVMPQMGESIAEGTITKWLKKVGDRVERDSVRVEVRSVSDGKPVVVAFHFDRPLDDLGARLRVNLQQPGALAHASPQQRPHTGQQLLDRRVHLGHQRGVRLGVDRFAEVGDLAFRHVAVPGLDVPPHAELLHDVGAALNAVTR